MPTARGSSSTRCLPNRHEKAMVVNFRERAFASSAAQGAGVQAPRVRSELPDAAGVGPGRRARLGRDPTTTQTDRASRAVRPRGPPRPREPPSFAGPRRRRLNRLVARRNAAEERVEATMASSSSRGRDLVRRNNRELKTELTMTDRAVALGRRRQDRGRHAEADAEGDDRGGPSRQTPHAQGAPVV